MVQQSEQQGDEAKGHHNAVEILPSACLSRPPTTSPPETTPMAKTPGWQWPWRQARCGSPQVRHVQVGADKVGTGADSAATLWGAPNSLSRAATSLSSSGSRPRSLRASCKAVRSSQLHVGLLLFRQQQAADGDDVAVDQVGLESFGSSRLQQGVQRLADRFPFLCQIL